MQLIWREQKIGIKEPTAGAYWRWLMALRAAYADDEYVDVIRWISEHVDDAASIVPSPIVDIEDHPIRLGEMILRAHEVGIRAMELTHRVADVDTSKIKMACECQRCRRKASYDAACIYVAAGISDIELRISRVDAELLALFWNRPYALYMLAKTTRACEGLREVPRHQRAGTKGKSPSVLKQEFKERLAARGKR